MNLTRWPSSPAIAFGVIVVAIQAAAPAFGTPAPPQSPGGQPISAQLIDQIRSRAERLAHGHLAELPVATRQRVLLDFVSNSLAEAANLPGFDTRMLSSTERALAERIVNEVLSPTPIQPQPAPAPIPVPQPQPSPEPLPPVVIHPSPYVVVPQNVVYVPASPLIVVPTTVVTPLNTPARPLAIFHHRGR